MKTTKLPWILSVIALLAGCGGSQPATVGNQAATDSQKPAQASTDEVSGSSQASGDENQAADADDGTRSRGLNLNIKDGNETAKIQIGPNGIDIEGKGIGGEHGKILVNSRNGVNITGTDNLGGRGNISVSDEGVNIVGTGEGGRGHVSVTKDGVDVRGTGSDGGHITITGK